MKKIFTLILLSMIAFNAIHAEIEWALSDDGTLTISGTDMPNYDNYNRAPWNSQLGKIKKVVIKNGVTSIGTYAFSGCSSLTSITIPNSVTSIGGHALYNCSRLTSIIIQNSVTSIGSFAFAGCSGITSIIVKDGNSNYDSRNNCNAIIETKSNTLILGCNNSVIPNSVTSIGQQAFNDCSTLTSVIIPNSVTNIGRSAFSGCSGLTSVTIGNSVTNIERYAFSGCTGLTSVTIPNSVTNIGRSAFSGCTGLTSVTIPNSVTSIGEQTFYGCSSLTSVTIPNSVTSIGGSAFSGCSGLTSVSIPNSVTSIGSTAFENCSNLASVIIPNSVTSIGASAFSGCAGLTSITIPESVMSIGGAAFDGAKLRNIVIKAKTPPSGGSAFSGQSYYHTTLMIPEGSWDAYAYSDNWYQFINIREMVDNAVNLTNSKAYMLKSSNEGSYLFYDSVNDCVATLNETALDDTEENVTWMTVEVDGKHYVYNLGAKKFLVADKTNAKTGYRLSDVPVSIDIEDGKDAIVFGKSKEFYMVINDKLNVDENLESQIIATTGIKGISVEANQPTVTYNVNGQIVPDNTKGLHIRNGKKVVVK